MDIKQFFKPTKLKIIIIAILLFSPLILQLSFFTLYPSDAAAYGFPLPFVQRVTYQCRVEGDYPEPHYIDCPEPHYVFVWISLAINIIFLYLITLLIIFLFEKFIKPIKNNIAKSALLSTILFLIFIIISYIFSIGYPFIKAMIGIGSPLIFYAYDPWTGPGIQLGSFFLWRYLIIDIIYWYIISILIIWTYNKFKSN